MEQILLLGNHDDRLNGFLKKMGYELVEYDGKHSIPNLIERKMLDLVLYDTRTDLGGPELINFLRSQEATRQVPIVCLVDRPRMKQEIKELGLERVELFDHNYQIGKVVSAIATQLRLTKSAGRDERTASLFEVNAALRDLTEHFKKEIKEARAIQESLLPKALPGNELFEMSVLYEPLEEVGGDWYFINTDSADRISIQIADVTGHGLSAAFVGSMTKLALTAVGSALPAETLTQMNRLLAPQLPDGKFITMGSYLFDPKSFELHYARAGHPPALLLRKATKVIEEIRGEGYAVGFFDDSQYTGGTVKLEPGDVFISITDGISEIQNRKLETYGMERIGNVLKGLDGGATADMIRDSIRADVDTFRDGRLIKDDISIIVLRCLSK